MLPRIVLALFAFTASVAIAEGGPTPEALGKQFDAQVARLVERGYPAMFGDQSIFDKEMSRLREEAVKYVPAKPGYTFLVVIPETYAPLPWQIRKIVLGGEVCEIHEWRLAFHGQCELRANGEFTTPDEPYLICDVDLGADTMRTWVCDALMEFRRAHRRGLTVLECTALLVQRPEMLSGTKVAATGTTVCYTDYSKNPCGDFAYWSLNNSQPPHHPNIAIKPWSRFNDQQRLWDDDKNFRFPSCKE